MSRGTSRQPETMSGSSTQAGEKKSPPPQPSSTVLRHAALAAVPTPRIVTWSHRRMTVSLWKAA